jgi:hypothetical protein
VAPRRNGSLRYLFEDFTFDTERRDLHRGERTLERSPECQLRANSRLMRRGKSRAIDQPVDADEHGSFGQSRFPKTLDHQHRTL